MAILSIFIFFCFLITITYGFIILSFLKGWNRLKTFHASNPISCLKVSVIIAARNEQWNIGNLLEDLTKQSYPQNLFEIILIDDGSQDNTRTEAKKFIQLLPLQIISKNSGGKKQAILEGIKAASGELIMTTDADCRVPVKWIETFAAYYKINHPSMIIGPVLMNADTGFFAAFQKLEFSSLAASAAGAIGINNPIMCNGANLAFRKDDFMDFSDPFSSFVPSGDDMMLMLNFKKKAKSIHYLKSTDALVKTKVESTWHSFFQQRIRWTSKNKYYNDLAVIKVATSVLLINMLIAGTMIAAFFNIWYLLFFLVLWAAKSVIDFPLILKFNQFFGEKSQCFFPVQIIYPLYIVAIGFVGNIAPYTWKERRLKYSTTSSAMHQTSSGH